MAIQYLTQEEFNEIYDKVPRLCVEPLIVSNDGILLTRRAINPGKGLWHFPGGTVLKGETLQEAVVRLVKRNWGWIVTLENWKE